jgi:selenocysteine-specific translation elongation factor
VGYKLIAAFISLSDGPFEDKIFGCGADTPGMEHSTVALLGPLDWARSIGKETSNTSFGIGALKRDDRIVTTLYPSKYPDKIWSLLFPLSLSDTVFLNISKIDKELGEIIIALDLAGKTKGHVHVDPMVDRSILSKIVKGTVVEEYTEFDPDPPILREKLFSMPLGERQTGTMVLVDQSFSVKGVGTVVLGFVTNGEVRKHQELFAQPKGKRTQIRSIQVHDKDQESSPAGSRVGLALKNIDPDDLPRGTALVSDSLEIEISEHLTARVRISNYWKEKVEKGDRYHLWTSLQFIPVLIKEVRSPSGEPEGHITIDMEAESRIWFRRGLNVGLSFLDSRSFRLFAVGEII